MAELNPHQFGDQHTLFDAPLGQPSAGTFKGNPHARLYRAVAVPSHAEAIRRSQWGDDIGGSDHDAIQHIMGQVTRSRQDSGHQTSMGIHWQHDLEYAKDYASDLTRYKNSHIPVIMEADHPGLEHVIDDSTDWARGRDTAGTLRNLPVPPREIGKDPDEPKTRRNKLEGHAKDWSLIHDTVGPHDANAWMVPEVPVRPGASLRVHALHLPDSGSWSTNSFVRNPVQFKGQA